MDFGKGAILWLLGVPLPIVLLALAPVSIAVAGFESARAR